MHDVPAMDLIFAESTPPGRGGISIIRLSGSGAKSVAETLVGELPIARRAYFRKVRDGDGLIDEALVLWFDGDNSFTGEELVELHLHGAPVIVRHVRDVLRNLNVRDAEPGEFTRRSFIAGKIDLAAAEGLSDLLEAETEAQRKQAIRSASGELSRKTESWRDALIQAGALVEVSVDFSDEDVPDDVPREVYTTLSRLCDELDAEIQGYASAERVRTGFEVAVIGPPNAGKSSLINYIGRRDISIVSEFAGTTRDVIELRVELQGLAVTFLDTAGIRDAQDAVEKQGVDLARKRAAGADLRLHLSQTGEVDQDLWQEGDITVSSKSDLGGPAHSANAISTKSGEGIDALLSLIFDILSVRVANAGLISHERQLVEMVAAREALSDIEEQPAELLAESIRQAGSSLSRLVGRIGAEDYLDRIFSTFCIGK